MRGTRVLTRANLPLCCTALLLLSVAVWCLATPMTDPAAARSPEQGEPPSLESATVLAGALVSETISPTTVLDLFFASSEVQWSPETSTSDPAGSESLAADAALFSGAPVFSWSPGGGTYSMDWGDVDRDGDLDLVTGSTDGVTVYRNDQGQFVQLWTRLGPALGVRWFDRAASPTGNPALEVVVVGASVDGQPYSPGTMELYLQAGTASPSVETYGVPAQLLRVEPRDYDGDDGIDLVVSTNALDPPTSCPVLLYRRDSVDPPYDSQPECVSNEATASLAAADADGDNDPDLALALHMSKELRVAINTGGALTVTNSVLVDSALPHIPYDLAWGDYDGDGQLDLAAAFPLEQQVRVYRATSTAPLAYTWAHTLTTTALLTPLALDWADVDSDGQLELIVGDLPPTVYDYDRGSDSFTASGSIPITSGRIQEIRAISTDGDTDLDLSVANQYGPSQLYENLAPILGTHLEPLGGGAADIAWGDYTGDGLLDLALATSGGVRLYASLGSDFDGPEDLTSEPASGLAWGDLDGDGDLDLAVADETGAQVYENTLGALASSWDDPWTGARAVAWADWNGDGPLDLAVAGSQGVRVYGHDGSGLSTTPVFSVGSLNAWDVAWADYDRDYYPDLAVASTQGVQVYHNQLGVLTALWSQSVGDNRSVAWADYDGDGWPELAAGRYGLANLLYDNQGGVLSTTPAYIGGSGATGNTTQLAWGDPDGDGDLDLAVANYEGKDLIYANTGSGLVLDLDLGLGWESTVISETTSLAWGDLAGDGDLDLAVTAGDGSGWYANNWRLPFHLGSKYAPLVQNPAILSMARPGDTYDAYFFSAAEVLAPPTGDGLVPFRFSYNDPEEEFWTEISLQYSLDGSGTWQTTQNFILGTTGGGDFSGEWDARADHAVSEDARLRLVAVDGARSGPVQRARSASTSPPFRVRATTCIWPNGLSIAMDPEDPVKDEKVLFTGVLEEGTGKLNFDWDLGDGQTEDRQFFDHIYHSAGEYTVEVTVIGESCPVTRPAFATKTFQVLEARSTGGMTDQQRLYLPLIITGAPQ